MDNRQHIEVKHSPLHGCGIFAGKSFERDEPIMVITGEVIDAQECTRREEEEQNVYIFVLDENRYLDTAQSEIIKYINHHCNPNTYVVDFNNDSLWLKAARPIPEGQELTLNYDYPEIFTACKTNHPECECPHARSPQV